MPTMGHDTPSSGQRGRLISLNKNILVALDFNQADKALALVDQLDPSQCRLKVGKELFTAAGPEFVKQLHARDFEVFLDLKFHDIPNTVAKACAAAADLGVWMLNVHAQGGRKMLEAAAESLQSFGNDKPLLIAVTILTSMDNADLLELGLPNSDVIVPKLAGLAKNSGLDGVVCSALEAKMIKQACGSDFLTITPGIRPANSQKDDQSRVMTPIKAVENGADYLVIGRPITQSENPSKALDDIFQQLQAL